MNAKKQLSALEIATRNHSYPPDDSQRAIATEDGLQCYACGEISPLDEWQESGFTGVVICPKCGVKQFA